MSSCSSEFSIDKAVIFNGLGCVTMCSHPWWREIIAVKNDFRVWFLGKSGGVVYWGSLDARFHHQWIEMCDTVLPSLLEGYLIKVKHDFCVWLYVFNPDVRKRWRGDLLWLPVCRELCDMYFIGFLTLNSVHHYLQCRPWAGKYYIKEKIGPWSSKRSQKWTLRNLYN